jgi:arylsulfatase A
MKFVRMKFPGPALLTFAVLHGLVAVAAGQEIPRQPNVILILVDDLGYRDLGCQGHPAIRTPVLDQLAASGARLTDFHSAATVCTPSRMSLLTGAYPVRLGWTQGVVGYKMGMRDGMSPEALTIAEIYQSAGYATGISGKWHIGDLPATRPHRQGFDWTYYIPSSNNQTDLLRSGDEVVEQPFDNRLLTRQFTNQALEFIRAKREQPFFLYLPYTAPHFPVEPHPEWEGRSKFGAYGDVVEELDHCIGEILTALEALQIRERTLVVFCSDNGPQNGEQASASPFRGQKWSALEGGTRVPCIINWPGVIPAGREIGALVSAMDLLPTLSRACGIDWAGQSCGKPKIDGLDLWETLLGKTDQHPRRELLLWHGMDAEPQAIRVGEWKLFFDRRHALQGPGVETETPEQTAKIKPYRDALKPDSAAAPFLIHLTDDTGELIDRSAEFPDKVASLRARAEELKAEIRAHPHLPIVGP